MNKYLIILEGTDNLGERVVERLTTDPVCLTLSEVLDVCKGVTISEIHRHYCNTDNRDYYDLEKELADISLKVFQI